MTQIRVAIIGLGNITHGYDDNPNVVSRMKYPTHLSALKQDKRFVIVAGSDPQTKAQQDFGKKVGKNVQLYSDYVKMINLEKPELLVVAAPTALHVSICTKAIALGVKIILCEKPIAYKLTDAKKLVQLAKTKKVVLVFNYFRNFDNSYNHLVQKIKAGTWGELRSITVNYAGGLFNMATHLIALVEKITGPITKVRGLNVQKKSKEIDSAVSFTGLAGQVPVFFNGVSNTKYRLFELDLCFEFGRLKLASDVLEEWKMTESHGFSFLKVVSKPTIKINIDHGLVAVYNNLYDHLKNKVPLLSTTANAFHALAVATEALQK